jgi:Ca2+-binding RTX toxin-like protein
MSAYALFGSNLVSFDPANPTVGTTIGITGLTMGDTLVGIDFRPQNGLLYGLGIGSGPAGTATLYAISARTGQATAIGAPITFVDAGGNPLPITGSNFGFDFNPTVDRIRVTTDTGLNFRINPNNGAPVDGNAGAPGTQPDGSINGATTTVDASAYTNNQPNVAVTTLYSLSAATDQLFIQNPPNNGTQTVPISITLNGNPLDFSGANGFDIPTGVNVMTNNAVASGSGLALLTVGGITGLYSIDLTTGAANKVGNVLDGTTPANGLANQNDLGGGIPAIALSADGTQLVRFNTATPGATVSVALTGISVGEVVVGIDFRPQTGQLFAFAVNDAANTGTIYQVDPQTGAATAVGPVGQVAFVDASTANPVDLPAASAGYGMDFNPTVDRIRVTTDTGLNFRINPNNGAPVDGNAGAAGINPDGVINGLPTDSTGVSANAYTNSFGQPLIGGVTTLYTLDAVSNSLFIQNPPNNGTQTAQVMVKLGASPLDFTSVNGFDIPAGVTVTSNNSPAGLGFGFASLTVGGATSLYMISLASGDAFNLGAIGSGIATAGLALGDSENDFYFVDDPGDVVTEGSGAGTDTVVTGLASYTLAANVEKLIGTSATGQALAGNALNNDITGGTGNDILFGNDGSDTLNGGAGGDQLAGGNGNDVLDGGDGNDTLTGGNGNDMLEGSVGNDVADGGNGDDTISGGDGADVLSGGRGDDNINTGQGDDVVLGGQGNDQIGGMAGRDVVMAGAGDDFIAWNDPTGDIVFGDGGNDTILGGNVAADEIHGGAGDDLIRAFATSPESATASDRLFGDAGDDTVIGGSAADIIEGGRGDDFLTGNDGADVFIFRDNRTGDDIITDFDPSEDVVQLVGFDEDFDPLAELSATARGAELDLGRGDSVLFLGRTVAEFSADDFRIV